MSPKLLDDLRQKASGCTACGLHTTRQKVVFGNGDSEARLMLIGEGPGEDEDRQGEPFMGRAGQLLNVLLNRAGLNREEVYVANVVKCRPPGNRDPEPREMTACAPFLHRQIELVNPRVLVALGRFATSRMTLRWGSMQDLLALKVLHYRPSLEVDEPALPVVAQYHPSYLLRNMTDAPLFKEFVRRLKLAYTLSQKPQQLKLAVK